MGERREGGLLRDGAEATPEAVHEVRGMSGVVVLDRGRKGGEERATTDGQTDVTSRTPRISCIMARCSSTASSTMASGGSVFHRHSVPTGFLWWRQQNTHLLAHARLRQGKRGIIDGVHGAGST